MLAAGNTQVTDLLCVTPPWIPDGAHAMTQLVELPPADAGVAPHRHSGPVFGYVLEGGILFELEGEQPREIVAGQAFWEPGGRRRALSGSESGRAHVEPVSCGVHLRSWRRDDHHARTRRDRGPRSSAPPERPPERWLTVAGDMCRVIVSPNETEVLLCKQLSPVTARPVSLGFR